MDINKDIEDLERRLTEMLINQQRYMNRRNEIQESLNVNSLVDSEEVDREPNLTSVRIRQEDLDRFRDNRHIYIDSTPHTLGRDIALSASYGGASIANNVIESTITNLKGKIKSLEDVINNLFKYISKEDLDKILIEFEESKDLDENLTYGEFIVLRRTKELKKNS